VGAFGATILIGVVAAFVLGNAAASPQHPSTPKTFVAIIDLVAGLLTAAFLVRAARRPPNPERTEVMIAKMGKVASSPATAIIAGGATLASPGVFIPSR